MSLRLGQSAEDEALDYLKGQGLELLNRNYRCKRGEIDLIMQQGPTLIFVEVRKRTSSRYGSAVESVDRFKQAKLLYSARHYLQQHPGWHSKSCRFDIVAIEGEAGKIRWIQNAFSE